MQDRCRSWSGHCAALGQDCWHARCGPSWSIQCDVVATLVFDIGSCMFTAGFAAQMQFVLCSLRLWQTMFVGIMVGMDVAALVVFSAVALQLLVSCCLRCFRAVFSSFVGKPVEPPQEQLSDEVIVISTGAVFQTV